MKDSWPWGFTPGERRALLLIGAAMLVGIGYRLYSRSTMPQAIPLTKEDSLGVAAIAQASEFNLMPHPEGAAKSQAGGTFSAPLPGNVSPEGLLDLNSASRQQLEALPGVGPVLAGRILETRTRLSGFRCAEDLLEVPGIGPRRLEQIRPLIAWESSAKNRVDRLGNSKVPQR